MVIGTRPSSLAAGLAIAIALLAAGGGQSAQPPVAAEEGATAWRGFVNGDRAAIAIGQRMIVVLENPSLADRIAEAGGTATESAMRQWTAGALAAQKQVAARLSREGIQLVPDFVYTRTFNGFAAPIDGRALALLERDPDVLGVYPVRAAYPAALSSEELRGAAFAPGAGRRAELGIPRFNGSGITVALLDTGVDFTHPFISDRLLDGLDMLDPERRGIARAHPHEPTRVERHGTQLAGLIAGSDGPGGIRGVVPAASILPIRVAGWQPSAEGGFAVYGRTDQLLAGIERAVDPDADGDVLDAARVAVVGVTEPFASFPDGPIARAIEGAARLDTLVVVPAGNEGPAGPSYGSIGGPGGAPDALTVAASDLRTDTASARVIVRAGLHVLLDREVALAGAAAPRTSLALTVARPRRDAASGPRGTPLARYFDDRGYSLVAGRATLLSRTSGPTDEARAAVLAGAAAILVDGVVPAGALGLDDRLDVPMIGIPRDAAAALRSALARGYDVHVSLGASGWTTNERRASIAPFSSQGLAFGGGIKPEVAAPGVEIVTADPGRNADRTARYATISGTSAATALAGGAAVALAQARPELDAAALKGALVGTSVRAASSPVAAQGAGALDPLAAAAAEVISEPATVGFGVRRQAGLDRRAQDLRQERLLPARQRRRRRGDRGDRGPLGHRRPCPRAARSGGEHADQADRARDLPAAPRRRDPGTGTAGGLRRRPRRRPLGGRPPLQGLGADRRRRHLRPLLPCLRPGARGLDRAGGPSARPRRAAPAPSGLPPRRRALAGQGAARPRRTAARRAARPVRLRAHRPRPARGRSAKGAYRLRVLAVPPDGPAEAETVDFRIR